MEEHRRQFSLLRLFGLITVSSVVIVTVKILWAHPQESSVIFGLAAFLSVMSGFTFFAAGALLILVASVSRVKASQADKFEKLEVGGRLMSVGCCGVLLPMLCWAIALWLLG